MDKITIKAARRALQQHGIPPGHLVLYHADEIASLAALGEEHTYEQWVAAWGPIAERLDAEYKAAIATTTEPAANVSPAERAAAESEA